jgi:hypothetical protein
MIVWSNGELARDPDVGVVVGGGGRTGGGESPGLLVSLGVLLTHP